MKILDTTLRNDEQILKKLFESNAQEVNKEIGNIMPKSFDIKWFYSTFGKTEWEYNCQSCTESLAKPIWNLLERGGKRWRPLLMLLCYNTIKKNSDNDVIIKKFMPLVEIIHNGSLIIDDIEDNSESRRGKPCVHKIFGTDIAVNAGNFMYYFPYLIVKDSKIDKKTKLLIHELIAEELLKIHFGQGTDIYWHSNNIIPTEEQYLQMCAYKTGTLARMSAKLGAILGNATNKQIDALGKFAESIGIAFQIQDDILNITNTKWGKDFGDDISEGKKSLIIIKTLEQTNEADRKKLLGILNLKTKDKGLIEEAIMIIKKYDAIDYSKVLAKNLISKAWNEIDFLISDSNSKDELKLFMNFVIDRNI